MSLLIGPDTIFTRMGSLSASMAGYYIYMDAKCRILHYLEWAASLLIGPDTIFIRMGSVLANKAKYFIHYDGKCPC